MTTQTEAGAAKSFVRTRLPWIVATLAGVVYFLTLNPWVSPKNLHAFARLSGQTWYGEFFLPAFNLVISPFRWLPETWIPAALNAFSAICAVIVLGLLARCVALLPQDRTYMQREREQNPFGLLSLPTAWIPPVLAVIVCGFQLTFWENATNLSSDMFDLVIFAYSVRCLLEYRISGRESWLFRAAFVYAAGMTDTWVLIALLPALVVALVWMRGLGFFHLRFLARLFLCSLAGLLLYLYLPLTHLRTDGAFWVTLKSNVGTELQAAIWVYRYAPHHLQFLLGLTSLLPILVIGIRWKSHFGDSSPLGTVLTTWMFHLTHAVLLAVCIWAAFDTRFSLRDAEGKFPFLDYHRDRMLPLYFLEALSVGYFSGYFLLVFKPLPQRSYRGGTKVSAVLSGFSATIVCALLILTPLGLFYKNVPQIKITNGPALGQYAAALTENLPPHAVLLSDQGDTLLIAQAWLAREGRAPDFVFLDTHALKYPAYHRFQMRRYPKIWPAWTTNIKDDSLFGDSDLTDLLIRLAGKDPIYYLQPSFGAYFETFYEVPHGLVEELKPYPTLATISPPLLPEAVFAENEAFWKAHEGAFRELLPFINPPPPDAKPTFRDTWMKQMRIPFEKNPAAAAFGSAYSQALNTLGVQDQQLGRLDAAGKHFAEAKEFFPDNVVAAANLEFNQKLRTGERIVADTPKSFESRFGNFSGWQQTLAVNGLFDTATGCLAQGIVFYRGGSLRQAARQFERVLGLSPNNPLADLWLARSYISRKMPERAFSLIQDLKAHTDSWDDWSIAPADVLRVELAAAYVSKKPEDVPAILSDLSDKNRLDAAMQTCLSFGDYTNTLVVAERRLSINPDDLPSLMAKGVLQSRFGNFGQAVPALTQIISLQPTNALARLYRARDYLETGQLDEAQLDYQILEKVNPRALPVCYGLGEIASRKKDTNTAVHYYELCLTNLAPDSRDAKLVASRIKGLQAGSP